jgi:hypothetical protein
MPSPYYPTGTCLDTLMGINHFTLWAFICVGFITSSYGKIHGSPLARFCPPSPLVYTILGLYLSTLAMA